MKLPIHRIIPFSNVEGIGNRSSIFVQGCNLNCLYCHNSETIPMKSEAAFLYTIEELVENVKGYMPFIRGITVSGGEPTIYYQYLTELFKKIKQLGLTCYIDTNGFFSLSKINELIEVTDKFLFDIKGIGLSLNELCLSNTLMEVEKSGIIKSRNGPIELVNNFNNLSHLLLLDKVEEVRLVYIKGFYDEEELISNIANVLTPYPKVLFKIIRVHLRGLTPDKIGAMKKNIPSKKDMELMKDLAYSKGIHQIKYIL